LINIADQTVILQAQNIALKVLLNLNQSLGDKKER